MEVEQTSLECVDQALFIKSSITSERTSLSSSESPCRKKKRKKVVMLVNYSQPIRLGSKWIPHILTAVLVAIATLGGTQTTEANPQRRIDPLLLEEYCKNFTHGNPSALEFYSPMYPKDYPSDITCFRTITADFGYFVRIDFRDAFRIEPPSNEGNCDYDYLEIRDGDQGYSPLIGKIFKFIFLLLIL